MKPLLIILTLLAVNFAQPAFAGEGDIRPSVLKSFQSTFSAAKAVEWTATDNLYKARFELNGQVVSAYYNNSGAMLAVTRNITTHQLPLSLQTSLKKEFNSFWVSDLFELNNDEGTTYYATLETAETKVVLFSNNKDWSVYSKTKKD